MAKVGMWVPAQSQNHNQVQKPSQAEQSNNPVLFLVLQTPEKTDMDRRGGWEAEAKKNTCACMIC